MTKKSEDRSHELSYHHYAKKWKTATYAVADTNEIAVKFGLSEDKVDKEDLSLELIRRFHSMFYKFMKLLITGTPDVYNNTQKSFLHLFSSGPITSSHAYKEIGSKCTIVFRNETPDDIYNILVLIFLQLLNRYNPKMNVGFVYYIDYFFKFHLKKAMISKYYDALDYQFIDSEDINSYIPSEPTDLEAGTRKASDIEGVSYEYDFIGAIDSDIDILEAYDGGPLSDLSTFEKYIIYLISTKGYRRADLTALFGFSNNKLAAIMSRIKKKTGRYKELCEENNND